MLNLLAQTETAVNWSLEILKMVAPAVLVLLGLWVWHLKKRSEPRYESLSYLEQKRLDCLMKAWSLLAYIAKFENPKAVMLWEKKAGETTYYLRPQQARDYMTALSEMFYDSGYGLLLPRKLIRLFYEYRGHLYDVLLKVQGQQNVDDKIKIDNGMATCLVDIYNELNSELRKELKKIE